MDLFSWFVGLFEGEGYVDVKQRRLIIGSTDRDVLERVVEAVGGGRINGPYGHPNENATPLYRYSLTGWENVEPLARRMLPHLCARRAEKLSALLDNPPAGGPYRESYADDVPCPQGHTGDFGKNNRGKRYCRTCQRERAAARYAASKSQ